jgi:hypothetical protein
MSQEISLKQAERRVFRAAFNDGLWDILIGCIVLQFAIGPLLSRRLGDFWSSAIFLPLWLLVCVGILMMKKYVVKPRIGLVRFGAFRKRRITRLITVMLVVNIIAFVLGTFFAFKPNSMSGYIYPGVLGYSVLVISSVAAYFLSMIRFFIYGLLFVISLIVGEWLFANFRVTHHGFPITFSVTAGIIIITGLVLFLNFLKENPIPVPESMLEEQNG